MPYIEIKRVNVESGEFVLVMTPLKRVYFDFNPDFYGKGVGSITNSLRKKFPISRKEIIFMTEDFLDREWYKEFSEPMQHAIRAFYIGAVESAQIGRRKFLTN